MPTYNHRDFWTEGAGAKGLDRAVLKIDDTIVFDNGDTMPAFARCSVASKIGSLPVHGPFRPLTDAQARYFVARPRAILTNVRADGTAQIADPTGVCAGYAPRYREMTPDGVVVVDR